MAERGPDGNYLFELEAHPGWPQGRSVRMTGSKPICQSSGPDAAGPGLAHSFLMAHRRHFGGRVALYPEPPAEHTHRPAGNPKLNDDDSRYHAR